MTKNPGFTKVSNGPNHLNIFVQDRDMTESNKQERDLKQ